MIDHEVEEEEPQAGHRKGNGKKKRNWKDKERITHFFCMTVCGMELTRTAYIGVKRK